MTKLSVAVRGVAAALGHILVATVGVAVSCAFCYFLLKPVLFLFISRTSLALNLPLRLPLFPLQSAFGFAVGYIWASKPNAFGQDKSARYVWIIPTIWFVLVFITWPHASVLTGNRRDYFFWSNLPEAKTLQLVTTLPLLTSLAYALGSYIGVRGRKQISWGLAQLCRIHHK
jgi:hypothetical protein